LKFQLETVPLVMVTIGVEDKFREVKRNDANEAKLILSRRVGARGRGDGIMDSLFGRLSVGNYEMKRKF
jgi:hypothetical protein